MYCVPRYCQQLMISTGLSALRSDWLCCFLAAKAVCGNNPAHRVFHNPCSLIGCASIQSTHTLPPLLRSDDASSRLQQAGLSPHRMWSFRPVHFLCSCSILHSNKKNMTDLILVCSVVSGLPPSLVHFQHSSVRSLMPSTLDGRLQC